MKTDEKPLHIRRKPLYAAVLTGMMAMGLSAVHAGYASGNPCAAKNPCAAANPCNPCAANPCAANPCAANPCSPCAAASPCGASGAQDPVAKATYDNYRSWKKVNQDPVLSATHGNRWVFTYINKKAEQTALTGDFPFPKGAVLAKASFVNEDGDVGAEDVLFVMEKRGAGYDDANNNWHYAMVARDGTVMRVGDGSAGSPTQFCAGCHKLAAVNDYVFGNDTVMKVQPTPIGTGESPCAANPCAANPCAANPCAANPCAANPCAANPCAANPCAANPCAANPCAANPCAAKNPCSPCAAANPCSPCGANPCAAKNPCAAS